MAVNGTDRDVLRRLAAQVAEIAALPVHQKKIGLWKASNSLKPVRPMVMIDQLPWHEMDVDGELKLQTQDRFCQRLETDLRRTLYRWKHLPADFVVLPWIDIPKAIRSTWFGVSTHDERAVLDPHNDVVGHAYIDQIKTDADIEKIHTPQMELDPAGTAQARRKAHAIFDGILDVRMQGFLPSVAGWDLITQWRNPEATLWDLADRPEFMHRLIKHVMDCAMGMLDQLEEKGLLGSHQSWIHCTGAFTDELPKPGFNPAKPRAKDLWTFGMAQIFASVSPAMHDEFEIAYMIPWYQRFGLVLLRLLRAAGRSPRLHPQAAERAEDLDEPVGEPGARRKGDRPGLRLLAQAQPGAARAGHLEPEGRRGRPPHDGPCLPATGCPLELILKDISTVRYQPQRLWEWEKIAMRVVEEAYYKQ